MKIDLTEARVQVGEIYSWHIKTFRNYSLNITIFLLRQ